MKFSKLIGFTYAMIVLALLCHFAKANPKQYEGNDRRRQVPINETEAAASDRTQRLGNLIGTGGYGTSGYGNSLGYGYGTNYGVGNYGAKIDLGGVVLGTIIGIGALLLLPKVVGVLAGHGGGYYRNNDETGVTDLMNRFDDFLAQHNVDSNACMQKAVCHFVRSSDYHNSVGTADQIESMISTLSENSIVEYMLDGTAIKEAISNAKSPTGRDCDSIYLACPLDRQSALNLMKKFFPLPGRNN
ncbi:hypothetical protein PVAND_000027 [Polypedilum vanderplanki]|uniref:Uncharacterized protein n=1 Tax=Polypedilum vanderplanki TaxID=319348 RepID=A0A9J6BIT8_POLVA|nr:hypothetical protein PVAND_000027 [Polypedilum vanderplanki]